MQKIQKNVVLHLKEHTHYLQYIAMQGMRKVYLMFFKRLRYIVSIYLLKSYKRIFILLFVVQVDLIIEKTDDFIVYQAVDQYVIEEQMLSDEAILSLNKIISYIWKRKDFKLDPFHSSCFSIKTNADFKIIIHSIGKALYLYILIIL